MRKSATIAAVRFGLGARPGEIERITRLGVEKWLTQQCSFEERGLYPSTKLKSSKENIAAIQKAYGGGLGRALQSPSEEAVRNVQSLVRETVMAEIGARSLFASRTPAPFHERLTQFWSNHFSVTTKNPQMAVSAGAYEREAIRPSIMGSFEELLIAAITHPAMLIYLDNTQSVGPNSRAGRRFDRGLNENLAREVLELHTVSSAGGYNQQDVTEFARALTGWTVGNQRFEQGRMGEAIFFDRIHEPGARIIMGVRYADNGRGQALAILKDLAGHPKTANHIAKKLARHFAADVLPQSLVAKLEAAFMASKGDLPTIYRALIAAPEAWSPALQKIKTPNELLTSAARMLGIQTVFAGKPGDVFNSLAQRPFSAPSPEGWPDVSEAWLGPDALMKRIEWSNRVAERAPEVDARVFLEGALGALASSETRTSVARAESSAQALALALMSPDFQRR